jgi:hypothetical protein
LSLYSGDFKNPLPDGLSTRGVDNQYLAAC